MANAARHPNVEPPAPPLSPEAARLQAWTAPPGYRAELRKSERAPAERPSLYYACAIVATLCALGWIVAGIADGDPVHFVLAAVWLGTTPFFVRAARRAAAGRS